MVKDIVKQTKVLTVLPCYMAQVHEPKGNTCEKDKKYITDQEGQFLRRDFFSSFVWANDLC